MGAVLLFVSSCACSELKTLGPREPKRSHLVSSELDDATGHPSSHQFSSACRAALTRQVRAVQITAVLLPLCSLPYSNRDACGCSRGLGCDGRRCLNQGLQPCPRAALCLMARGRVYAVLMGESCRYKMHAVGACTTGRLWCGCTGERSLSLAYSLLP